MPHGSDLYKSIYCLSVIEYGKKGYSITGMAATIGVCRDTIYEWEKRHPKFKEALQYARTCAQHYYEEIAHEGLYNRNFKHGLWFKIMRCRFPKDYNETKNINLGGQPNNPININLNSCTDEQLAALAALTADSTDDTVVTG